MEPSPALGDEDVLRQIAAGDRAALAALYDRYSPLLLAQARRMLKSPSEAEDLVHDVFLEVWRRAHTYTPARGSVRAWLTVRVRSRAVDRLRLARNTRHDAQDVSELADLSAAEPEGTPGLDHDIVQRALAGLPAEQRAVLELFYFDGLSLPEIGERLTVPVGTVKSRASRALSKLRTELCAPAAGR